MFPTETILNINKYLIKESKSSKFYVQKCEKYDF